MDWINMDFGAPMTEAFYFSKPRHFLHSQLKAFTKINR